GRGRPAPPLRKLSLQDCEREFGPDLDLARQGRDHPGLEISFSSPDESLEGFVRLSRPCHPVAERFSFDASKLGRRLAVAAARHRIEDDARASIGELRFAATRSRLSWKVHLWGILQRERRQLLDRKSVV